MWFSLFAVHSAPVNLHFLSCDPPSTPVQLGHLPSSVQAGSADPEGGAVWRVSVGGVGTGL